MPAPSVALQLFFFTTSIVSDAISVVICATSITVQDEVICEVSRAEYVCLVCPFARNEMGLMWQDGNNNVIFRENVRTAKKNISFVINDCDQDNYTLSFVPTEFRDETAFVCLVGDKSLSRFIVQITDIEESSYIYCRKLYEKDRQLLCGISGNSSVCLVCPVSRETPGISWKYRNNTLFRNDVSIGDRGSSLTVNNCSSDNYTLSFENLIDKEQGKYSCLVTENTITEFFVYNKAFPEITLTCKTGQSSCNLNNTRCNLLLMFECTVMTSRTPFTIIWSVDDIIVKDETYSSVPDSYFITSHMQYTSNGNGRNFTCQVQEESFTTGRKTLHFSPIRKDKPSVKIFHAGQIVRNPITVNTNETMLTCIASNVKFPKKLFWDIDNRQVHIENKSRTNRCDFEIHLNFQPNTTMHNVSCVYKSPFLDEIRTSVTLYSRNNTEGETLTPFSRPIIFIFSGLVLGVILVTLLCGLLKTNVFSRSLYRRLTTIFKKPTNSNAMYFEMEVGEETAYVRLKTRISSDGRLERWVGDLTGVTTNQTTCMVNACKEDTTETEYEEFRKLAMTVKDMRNHINVVEVIAVEVEKVPNMIYTEFIEGVTLKGHLTHQRRQHLRHTTNRLARFAFEVISAMVHLKSYGLAHPGIRCQKVLLTESLICKIYDFCTYPVIADVISNMMKKNNNSVMPWLSKETRADQTHTFQSDSFSSAVFVWEVFSWGKDPSHSIYMVPVECNEEYLPKPEMCHETLYSIMQRCWRTDTWERPGFEEIQNELSTCIDDNMF